MNATSGITIADDLQTAFAAATQSIGTRFLKLAIQDESIVLDTMIPSEGDLVEDLHLLQDTLDENVPAYVLARLDGAPSQWLAITYVPDTAKVRDKMLYASTRSALTKSLGSASFSDALFATHKSDLTPDAYAAHRRHQAAPKPLSAREQEMADLQAAERAAGTSVSVGSSARKNHLGGAGVGFKWTEEVEGAMDALTDGEGSRLVVISVDTVTETLVLFSNEDCAPNDVGAALPPSEPSYAFFAWSHVPQRDIVFIYSCPSASPIKHRMLYSSGVLSMLAAAKGLGTTVTKKIETSDPREITEAFLRAELGLSGNGTSDEKPAFAKPRGPARKQR